MSRKQTVERVERIVPKGMLTMKDGIKPVLGTVLHQPGQHEDSPIKDDLTAVEVVTESGSRWFGTERAWVSDGETHVMVNPQDVTRAEWPKPSSPGSLRAERAQRFLRRPVRVRL